MINVLVVDDHASFRTPVAFMINREEDITTMEAGSLAEARSLIASAPHIDVALVDLNLPDGAGLTFLPELHARHPNAAAIVLTGSDTAENHALAIASGAVGFLHKSTTVSDILNTIRLAAAGESLLSPTEIMRLMRQAIQYQAHTQAIERALAQLTPREMDVLRALADGLDNQAIADRLSLSTTTVRSHVVQLLRKLDVSSRLQAALIAVRHGITNEQLPH